MLDSTEDIDVDRHLPTTYTGEMPTNYSNTLKLTFRVTPELKSKFEKKFPVYTKRGKVLRELLRMYLNDEIKVKTKEAI